VIPRPEIDCSIPLLIPREGCQEVRTLVGKEEVELTRAGGKDRGISEGQSVYNRCYRFD